MLSTGPGPQKRHGPSGNCLCIFVFIIVLPCPIINYNFHVPSANIYLQFRIIKPSRWTNFSNFFWKETLHVSNSSSVHHQEFITVHTAVVYVIPFC